MIREAVAGDEPALEAYLRKNFATTMFMRGNLRDFGLGNTVDRYAMRYFMALKNGAITGVCGVANFGTLMGQADEHMNEIAVFARNALAEDFDCKGILGAPDQCEALREAFDLGDAETSFNEVEPLFSLDLEDLHIPEHKGLTIRAATGDDEPLLAKWAYEYLIETGLHEAGNKSREIAANDAKMRLNTEKFRILMLDGKPVAQTGFNAQMPDCVQIGGVYTPPHLRRNGYGRTAVALHLAEARKTGIKKAILFAANKYAARAYIGIGFQQIGSYVITLFKTEKD